MKTNYLKPKMIMRKEGKELKHSTHIDSMIPSNENSKRAVMFYCKSNEIKCIDLRKKLNIYGATDEQLNNISELNRNKLQE